MRDTQGTALALSTHMLTTYSPLTHNSGVSQNAIAKFYMQGYLCLFGNKPQILLQASSFGNISWRDLVSASIITKKDNDNPSLIFIPAIFTGKHVEAKYDYLIYGVIFPR